MQSKPIISKPFTDQYCVFFSSFKFTTFYNNLGCRGQICCSIWINFFLFSPQRDKRQETRMYIIKCPGQKFTVSLFPNPVGGVCSEHQINAEWQENPGFNKWSSHIFISSLKVDIFSGMFFNEQLTLLKTFFHVMSYNFFQTVVRQRNQRIEQLEDVGKPY